MINSAEKFVIFAKLHELRKSGALPNGKLPELEAWAGGGSTLEALIDAIAELRRRCVAQALMTTPRPTTQDLRETSLYETFASPLEALFEEQPQLARWFKV